MLKDKTKQHWLKIDFNKWKNEDDSDDEGAGGAPGGGGGGDLEEVMVQKKVSSALSIFLNCPISNNFVIILDISGDGA